MPYFFISIQESNSSFPVVSYKRPVFFSCPVLIFSLNNFVIFLFLTLYFKFFISSLLHKRPFFSLPVFPYSVYLEVMMIVL